MSYTVGDSQWGSQPDLNQDPLIQIAGTEGNNEQAVLDQSGLKRSFRSEILVSPMMIPIQF